MLDLEDIVATRIELAGVTRRQLEAACQAVPQVTWERLPLYTDLTLDEQPLQQALRVKTPVDLDTFIAVYEEFVAGFLLTREYARFGPGSWLAKRLLLSQTDAAQLFSDGTAGRGRRRCTPRDKVLITVALAALAEYSYGATIMKNTPTQFVVRATEYAFGIEEGKPRTNLGSARLGPRIAAVTQRTGLAHSGRHRPIAREASDASIYAQLAAFDAWRPGVLGERGGVKLALAILRHRHKGSPARRISAAVVDGVDPAGYRQALRLCSGFEQMHQPYNEMRALLVPSFVKPHDFVELFGRTPRAGLTRQRAQQWRLALDHLAAQIKETA